MRRVVLGFTSALIAAVLAAPPGARAAAPEAAGSAPRPDDGTRWGVVARGGAFGVPNFITDEFFVQHPKISGMFAGAELRYFGDGGGRGVSSIALALDHGTADADGTWQGEESDDPVAAEGSVTMTAITLTGYWNLFPSWWLHPYIGLGFGAAHFDGEYEDEDGPVDESGWLPVVHVPVGLAFELGRHLQLAGEARFLGGFTGGASLLLRF